MNLLVAGIARIVCCMCFISPFLLSAQVDTPIEVGKTISYTALTGHNGSTANTLKVTYRADGSANIICTSDRAKPTHSLDTYFLTESTAMTVFEEDATGTETVRIEGDLSEYWIVPFNTGQAMNMTSANVEVTCDCIVNPGSCDVEHSQNGNSQTTSCKAQGGCGECKMKITNSSLNSSSSVLVIRAHSVNVQVQ